MAYGAKNINPLDLRPSTGIGVALPFDQPGVFKTVYTTQEQTKYNMINFLLTDPGERVFEPTFGLGLRRKLFEQLTPGLEEDIRESIRTGIERYFPFVEVTELKVLSYPDQYTLRILLSYRNINTDQTDQISIDLQNGQ